MTIEEVYAAIGGDYQEALKRLVRPQLLQKFAVKFLNDRSFDDLAAAIDSGDAGTAFGAAHTLKGVSRNLAFTKLADSAAAITEVLREKDMAAAKAMLLEVESDYRQTVDALKQL